MRYSFASVALFSKEEDLLYVASFPVIKVLLITALGLFLAIDNIDVFGTDARKKGNNLLFYVFNKHCKVNKPWLQMFLAALHISLTYVGLAFQVLPAKMIDFLDVPFPYSHILYRQKEQFSDGVGYALAVPLIFFRIIAEALLEIRLPRFSRGINLPKSGAGIVVFTEPDL